MNSGFSLQVSGLSSEVLNRRECCVPWNSNSILGQLPGGPGSAFFVPAPSDWPFTRTRVGVTLCVRQTGCRLELMNLSDTPPPNVAPIIALDGPAGAGKSTVAVLLAAALDLPYLDTGAMYRAVGLMAYRDGWRPPLDPASDGPAISRLAKGRLRLEPGQDRMRLWVDEVEVTQEIRSPECSVMASAVSALSEVRRALVPEQRRMGLVSGGVMEGRDIGSVVFPDAALKVFLTASPQTRAQRRYDELVGRGVAVTLEEVLEDQSQRDFRDSSRADSPLVVAPGAVVVDTSGMTLHEVVEYLAGLFSELGEWDLPELVKAESEK